MDAHDDDRNNHHRSPSNRARNGISYKMGTAVNQAAMNGRRMLLQASLVAGALLAISGCSDIPMSTAKPTLNMLPIFYKANPVTAEQPAVYKTIDACYLLVDWNDFASTQNKYLKKGYVPLGHCDFAKEMGVPLTDNAIEYGRYLGANVIIYAVHQTMEGQTEHYISYLAKRRRAEGLNVVGLGGNGSS